MATATATKTLDHTQMGIEDFPKAIAAAQMTVREVIVVLDARIQKRKDMKRPPVPRVIAYRNELVESYNQATGLSIPAEAVPTYTPKVQANAALPTDPDQLADTVFATVGAAGIGQVIARLTARVVGA